MLIGPHSLENYKMRASAKTIFGFAMACLMVFVAMASSNISLSDFIEDIRWMVHTTEVRSEIEKFSTYFLSAQNNIRAYHMVKQDYYLNLHSKAKIDMFESLAKLKGLTTDNSTQQRYLENIDTHIRQKVAIWNQSIEQKTSVQFRNYLMSEKVKELNDTLFESIDAFKREEDRLFNIRIQRANQQGRDAKFIVWFGGILACLLITAAAFIVYRDSRRREMAEDNVDRFFKLSLDLLCISGMDGYFKRLSPSFQEVLGYPLKELYSRPILDFVHPDDIKATQSEIERQMQGHMVLSFENRFRCADGNYKTFSWKSVPVGEFMYAVARDVTLQKQFETDLLRAREAAQSATVAKSSFLANMSHEIRTPLNGVVGMADLLTLTSLNTEQKGFVNSIISSAKDLLKIVNEILDFSKLEAGRMHVEKVNFDLAHLVKRQVGLMSVLANEKNLKVETWIDPTLPKILSGDSVKIGQVLLNLLNNAVKFTDFGQISVRAEVVSSDSMNCEVKVSVRDSGIGINEEQQSLLFEPFAQADQSTARKYGGTGLGLSICKRYIELMGGQVGLESQLRKGSLFWFKVPLAKVKESDIEDKYFEISQPEQTKSLRVLLAEDNAMNQAIAISMMSALGYTSSLAKNGKEAVELFKTHHFDLILMDQNMPVMDGLEASRAIRELEKGSGKRTPIIAFTATVAQEEQRQQYADLMDGFILKPVTLEALSKALQEWENRLANQPTSANGPAANQTIS